MNTQSEPSTHSPKSPETSSKPNQRWFQFWNTPLQILFPPRCVGCNHKLGQEQRNQAYPQSQPTQPIHPPHPPLFPGLCVSCVQSVTKLETPLCLQCSHPVQQSEEQPCYRCREQHPRFAHTYSLFAYTGAIRSALHRYKLRGDFVAGRMIQEWFRQHIHTLNIPWKDYDIVSCVPLHPEKLHQRGFNQALQLLLCLRLPSHLQHPSLLDRAKKTKPLYSLKAHEREHQLEQAFVVRSLIPGSLRQKNILLIDDVLTTGATAHQCSLSLHQAGANRVDVLTLCRAVR